MTFYLQQANSIYTYVDTSVPAPNCPYWKAEFEYVLQNNNMDVDNVSVIIITFVDMMFGGHYKVVHQMDMVLVL